MDEKKDVKIMTEAKEPKEQKQVKSKNKVDKTEEETIIAYAQLAIHTLQHSATEITPRSIKSEIKMFYEKFGNQEVIRLANIIMKEKKQAE